MREILAREAALRPREALSGGVVVCTVEIWRRYFLVLLLHGEAGVPLLREGFLSFGIVAVRPIIPGPVAGVAFQSFQFDLAWRAEASEAGNAARSRSDRGNSGPEQSFRTLYTHESCI
jgi:hypothetical protein